jgi:hypothetical protein
MVDDMKRDVDYHFAVRSFDSCTVVFDEVHDSSWKGILAGVPARFVYRSTVPLALLKRADINKFRLPDKNIISGDTFGYYINLTSTGNTISHEELALFMSPKASVDEFARIAFNEESVAQRAQKAFLHAAELCREREPF